MTDLFANESVARTVILLAIAGAAGNALGKVRVFGVGLGVAGVLFVGLVLGHLKFTFDHGVLEFVREFGLILFVYTLGLQIGPGFFASLRRRGLELNLLAAGMVLLGAGVAAGWIILGRMNVPAGTGLLSGATTNTPSLAAAQQALRQTGAEETAAIVQGLGYAVAYPFGIIGIVVAMMVLRLVFRIDVKREVEAAEIASRPAMPSPSTRNFEVRNPALVGCPLSGIPGLVAAAVVISRFSRGGRVELAQPDTTLQLGDVLHAVGPESGLNAARLVIGAEAGVDLKSLPGPVINRRLIVTQPEVFGHPLAELPTLAEHRVVVTRVTRGDLVFTPNSGLRLQFGDVLMVVGESAQIDAVATVLGNSPKALQTPQLVPFFVGILAGVFLGSVPIFIPGLPAPIKLGLAGGPLVAAILLSRLVSTGPWVWHLPQSANQMLREVGISLFLAAVGIKSGEKFLEVLMGADGLLWMAYGAVITLLPLLLVGALARAWKKMNYAELCGLLAGSMTDPPALAFAQQMMGSTAPAVAYATVYPFVMLLRVFSVQVLIFLLCRTAA